MCSLCIKRALFCCRVMMMQLFWLTDILACILYECTLTVVFLCITHRLLLSKPRIVYLQRAIREATRQNEPDLTAPRTEPFYNSTTSSQKSSVYYQNSLKSKRLQTTSYCRYDERQIAKRYQSIRYKRYCCMLLRLPLYCCDNRFLCSVLDVVIDSVSLLRGEH